MSDRPGIINLQGKDYATWPYVLDKAHQKGLNGIHCDIVQIPTKENGMLAIVRAVASFAEGGTYSALGDASPESVGPKIAKHIVRMAETRAKGRALRDALNIGMTLQEELGEDEDALPSRPAAKQNGNGHAEPAPAKYPQPPADATRLCPRCKKHALTEGQIKVSTAKYGAPACPACQRELAQLAAA